MVLITQAAAYLITIVVRHHHACKHLVTHGIDTGVGEHIHKYGSVVQLECIEPGLAHHSKSVILHQLRDDPDEKDQQHDQHNRFYDLTALLIEESDADVIADNSCNPSCQTKSKDNLTAHQVHGKR